ncbi:MAG TPA: ribonuclease HII [Gemmatimonadaceae bacterium]|nr:ribonuclease HII [Gemmatimonadaceae bacterium]
MREQPRVAHAGRRRWSTIERDLRRAGGPLIAGVDEVGRGCLAGPVVACAVVMPPDERAIGGVDDSKLLTARARERLARLIRAHALGVGVGAASSREIDRINILQASVLAMRRALGRLRVVPNHVLVDGRPLRTLGVQHTAIIDGDDRCFSIACASIIAKVIRDRLMHSLAMRHPAYAWDRNCGYATRSHIEGLITEGPSVHHRRSFLVKAILEREQLPLAFEEQPISLEAGLADLLAHEHLLDIPATLGDLGPRELPPA